jgi:hypothetical protein
VRSRQKPAARRQPATRRADPLALYDLIRATECDVVLGDDSFRVRVELTRSRRSLRRFRANVWAAERYRIQSTFPQAGGRPTDQPSDELVWVNWSTLLRMGDTPFSAPSVTRAETIVLDELRAWVRHARGECGSDSHTWGDCARGPKA